jgi:predicted neutral ceramidase superfamily lipid hydrolase
MFKSGEAPRSGLGFFSTCSCCLTWCCYGIAKMNPSIYLPNAAGFVVGTVTTLLFVGLTEQRMGSTLLLMVTMASAVLALMFGGIMPADEATQWTANIGIVQSIVMLGSGCAVWPTVRCRSR